MTAANFKGRLSRQFLLECFKYDTLDGSLTWKVRPRDHFASDHAHKRWNTMYAGKRADRISRKTDKYVRRTVSIKGTHLAHRVIWFMLSGTEPESIDHINGDPTDNNFRNLEAVSQRENVLRSNTKMGNAVVDEATVKSICNLLQEGVISREVSSKLSVSRYIVDAIRRRIRWTDISKDYTWRNNIKINC